MITRKPRKNDRIVWPADPFDRVWTVTDVDDNGICWLYLPDGPRTQSGRTTSFIYRFSDGTWNRFATILDKETKQ